MQNRAKLDEWLIPYLEPISEANRPATPSPSSHKSTKKPRPGVTSFPTPDSRDRTSAGKKRVSQLESLETPDVSPCPKRPKDTALERKSKSNFSAMGLGLPRSEGREARLVVRMDEEDHPVPGVDLDQMKTYLYVSGKLQDAFKKRI
jgi:hypothetical protein